MILFSRLSDLELVVEVGESVVPRLVVGAGAVDVLLVVVGIDTLVVVKATVVSFLVVCFVVFGVVVVDTGLVVCLVVVGAVVVDTGLVVCLVVVGAEVVVALQPGTLSTQ